MPSVEVLKLISLHPSIIIYGYKILQLTATVLQPTATVLQPTATGPTAYGIQSYVMGRGPIIIFNSIFKNGSTGQTFQAIVNHSDSLSCCTAKIP